MLSYSITCFAQEIERKESKAGMLRLTGAIQHTHIRHNTNERVKGIFVTGWAFDADYWLSNRVAFGLTSDIILENFIIHKDSESGIAELERNFPVSLVPTLYFRPLGNLNLFTGYGLELSKEKDLNLFRVGIEYGFELPQNWEIGVSAIYDTKIDAYDSYSLGVGISKHLRFGRHMHK